MNEYSLYHHLAIAMDKVSIWYYADQSGYVMEIDVTNGKMKCLFSVPDYNSVVPAYRNLFYHAGKIYVLPYATKNMYVYDLTYGIIEKVNLSQHMKNCYFTGCIYRNGSLYLYGVSDSICIYNLADGKMKWEQLLSSNLGISYKPENWFWTEALLHEDDIYLVMVDRNGMIKIDLDDKFAYVCLGEEQQAWSLRDTEIQGNEVVALYSDETLQTRYGRYDLAGRQIECHEVLFKNQWNVYPYLCAEFINNMWIVYPYKTREIYAINTEKEEITTLYTINGINDMSGKYYFGGSVKGENGTIYAINQVDGTLISISAETMEVAEKNLHFSEKDLDDFHSIVENRLFENKDIITETNNLINVDVFVKGLAKR